MLNLIILKRPKASIKPKAWTFTFGCNFNAWIFFQENHWISVSAFAIYKCECMLVPLILCLGSSRENWFCLLKVHSHVWTSFKKTKNGFHFTWKGPFLLEIFQFLFWTFAHGRKRFGKKAEVDFKIYDVTKLITKNCSTRFSRYLNEVKAIRQ